jgi:preprotein translocase subunit SecE
MAQTSPKESTAPAAPERAKPRSVPATTSGGNSFIARQRRNVEDILSELRKVTWPSREETRNLTIVVIGLSVALGMFLGGIDLLLSSLYTWLDDLVKLVR